MIKNITRGQKMIRIKEKDLHTLGIKSIELDTQGNIINVVGSGHRMDMKYKWALLGLDYMGGGFG